MFFRLPGSKNFTLLFATLGVLLALTSCEEDINVDVPESETSMVMEARIENGGIPILLLTRDQAFFSDISASQLTSLFIDSADVWITNFKDTVRMQPVNLSDLPEGIELPSGGNIPLDLSQVSEDVNLTAYIPTSGDIVGRLGDRYKIHAETKRFEASSTTRLIQPAAKLDSVFYTSLDNPDQDTLVRVSITVNDPEGLPSYYRFFTKRNANPFYAPLFGSVATDAAVDGEVFDFPINRAYPRLGRDQIEDRTPFFERGDTVTIKLCAIEEEVYRFWNTLEDDLRNQGNPFGSATIIQDNVEGGLGVFAGYACDTATVTIPE